VAYYAKLGVTIKRLLTDNGSAFRSHDFPRACVALGIRHRFTRAHRPQTNGKAERFIQSALREWRMAGRTRTQPTELPPWPAGSTTTTGTDRIAASAGSRPCPDSLLQDIAS
jgi:transposase InsO family protein